MIAGRGDTLNRALLTVTLSSPLEGVVKVRIEHHHGTPWSGGFELLGAEDGHGVATVEDGGGVLESGPLRARVRRGAAWDLAFEADGRTLTRSGHRRQLVTPRRSLPPGPGPEASP